MAESTRSRFTTKFKIKKIVTKFRDSSSTLVASIRSKTSSKKDDTSAHPGRASTADTKRPSDATDFANEKRDLTLEEEARRIKLTALLEEKAALLTELEEDDRRVEKAYDRWHRATDIWSRSKGFITHGNLEKARLKYNRFVRDRTKKKQALKEMDRSIEVCKNWL